MKTTIQHLLAQITLLLSENNEQAWAKRFEFYSRQLDVDYDTSLSEIKGVFGGAGPFNDLVLHNNQQMQIKEKNK